MYKLYLKGNYVFLEILATGQKLTGFAKEVKIIPNSKQRTVYTILNIHGWSESTPLTLINLQKENGVTYTESEFETFYTESTGNFSSASGGSGAELDAIALALLDKLPKGTHYTNADQIKDDIVAISTGVQGVGATTSNSPTGTGVASWLFAGGGTYTNYGGLVIPANYVGFITRSDTDVYSYVGFELDLAEYVKKNRLPQSADLTTNLEYPTKPFEEMTSTGGDLHSAGYVNKNFKITSEQQLKSITIKSNGDSIGTLRAINIAPDGTVTILHNYFSLNIADGINTYVIEDSFVLPKDSYIYLQASSLFYKTEEFSYRVYGSAIDSSVVTSYYFKTYTFDVADDILTKDVADSIYEKGSNIVALRGDSITWGAAPENGIYWSLILQNLLGSKYQVVNCGVGGENAVSIPARQGAIPMYNSLPFTLPSSTNNVAVGRINDWFYDGFFKSTLDDAYVQVLVQGEGRDINTINPCVIDGIECTLSSVIENQNPLNIQYYIKRNEAGEARLIDAGNVLHTNEAITLKPHASIYFMGTNDGWIDVDDLIERYKRMIAFDNVGKRFLVVGIYGGYAVTSHNLDKEAFELMEKKFTKAFGANYVNLRKYTVEKALQDAGITPTAQDLADIALGKCPQSLLADGLHPNSIFSELIPNLFFKRLKLLI